MSGQVAEDGTKKIETGDMGRGWMDVLFRHGRLAELTMDQPVPAETRTNRLVGKGVGLSRLDSARPWGDASECE